MKIRTDFVTNSSSSSFTVSIDIKTVEGKSYRATIEPDDGGGNGSADINCSAASLLTCTSVASLMDTIYDAVTVTTSHWGNEEEDKKYFAKGVQKLATRVKNNVQSLDQISTLTFRRKWHAWGECSSCFGTNIGVYAPELCSVAEKLCDAYDEGNEEECEAYKKELLFYLKYYDGIIEGPQGGSFPSGFMGSSATCVLDIYGDEDDLVEFAYDIAGGSTSFFDDDDGVETTIIDMQSKTIRQGAVYGDCSCDGIQKDDTEYENLQKFVYSRQRKRYAEIRLQALCLIKSLSFYSGPIDYWKKTFVGTDLPDGVRYLGGQRQSLHGFVNSGNYRNVSTLPDYWIVDIDEMLPEADTVEDDTITSALYYSEELMHAIQIASNSNARFIEKTVFCEAVEQERQNNYPYAEKILTSRKSSIPFDHVSTVACKDKIFATANLVNDYHERTWLYEYLCIDREVPSCDAYPTRNWLIEKGAFVKSDVTRNCDYLIVGMNATIDTAKVAKAIQYRDSGKSDIKIISEDELLRMLNGEVLEIPEEYQQALQDRQDAMVKAEEEKQKKKEESVRQFEEIKSKKVAEKEAKRKAAAEVQEALRKEREERKEAILQQKAAEQEAREEKQRRDAEERERMIRENVLYRPGEEPADIRIRLAKLFEKLDGAYPDKKISGLNRDHKKVGERVTELYRLLGYPDNRAFLEAYGYTIAEQENKGGRPTTVDPEAFIEELKRRYPNGSGFKSVNALSNDNEDLPFKSMTNNAQKIFGMSLGDYLKSIGIL